VDALNRLFLYHVAMNSSPYTVLVIEPQPLMRAALCAILAAETDLTVAAQTVSGAEALERVKILDPGLILLALGNPGLEDLQAIRALRQLLPGTSILALTSNEVTGQEQAALAAGAQTVLSKAAPRAELLRALRNLRGSQPAPL
jgi:DNA-binding NarL/FixJ family response regulator